MNEIDSVFPLIVRSPLTLYEFLPVGLTSVKFSDAEGNFATPKKSSDFKWPSKFPLYSPYKSVTIIVDISISKYPPVNMSLSKFKWPDLIEITPS